MATSDWISLGAFAVAGISLFLAIRSSRLSKHLEAATRRTRILSNLQRAKEMEGILKEKLESIDLNKFSDVSSELRDDYDRLYKRIKHNIQRCEEISDKIRNINITDPIRAEHALAESESLIMHLEASMGEADSVIAAYKR